MLLIITFCLSLLCACGMILMSRSSRKNDWLNRCRHHLYIAFAGIGLHLNCLFCAILHSWKLQREILRHRSDHPCACVHIQDISPKIILRRIIADKAVIRYMFTLTSDAFSDRGTNIIISRFCYGWTESSCRFSLKIESNCN